MRATPDRGSSRQPTVRFATLGCRLNQSESDEIARELLRRGVSVHTSAIPNAEVVVVNTCTVTADASRSSRKLIRKLASTGAKVIVTGCYAVADPDAVAVLPGVVAVVANVDKDALAGRIARSSAPLDSAKPIAVEIDSTRVRQSRKVQTGCDEICSFCIIPTTRGDLSSRCRDDIVEGIRIQVAHRASEIVLTGVNLGKYGLDAGEQNGLERLIEQILTGVPELAWLRLSSIEACTVTDSLLDLIASEDRICNHLHIPLQSGDDGVLGEMRRPYDVSGYIEVVAKVRRTLGPDVGITADVMVGFPGESEDAFENTCNMVREVRFSKLHVFRYSSRDGTDAARRADHVHADVSRRRSATLRRLGEDLSLSFNSTFVGRNIEFMAERVTSAEPTAAIATIAGTAGNYVKVTAVGPSNVVGRPVEVAVSDATSQGVIGKIVTP